MRWRPKGKQHYPTLAQAGCFKHLLTVSCKLFIWTFWGLQRILGIDKVSLYSMVFEPNLCFTLLSTSVSHLTSGSPSVSVCLSRLQPISPSWPSLTTGEGPLIGADRTRYPPTPTLQLSVLPNILQQNHQLKALCLW